MIKSMSLKHKGQAGGLIWGSTEGIGFMWAVVKARQGADVGIH